MSTIEEFRMNINRTIELKEEVKAVNDMDALSELLKKHNCRFTLDDLMAAAKRGDEGALSDDELCVVSGGVDSLKEFLLYKSEIC